MIEASPLFCCSPVCAHKSSTLLFVSPFSCWQVTRERQRKDEDFEKAIRSSFTGFKIDLQIPPLTLLPEGARPPRTRKEIKEGAGLGDSTNGA